MEQRMDDLVCAIEALSTKNAMDYLLVIVPIGISLIAIGISISIAQKQNKIALFEKRYESLSHVRTMLAFSESIYDGCDKVVVFCLFDGSFGTSLWDKNDDERFIEAMDRIERLKSDVMQVKFLFPSDYNIDLEEIVNCLREYIIALAYDREYFSSRDRFCQKCKEFGESDFRKMIKRLEIK